jgi:hypothetical protein
MQVAAHATSNTDPPPVARTLTGEGGPGKINRNDLPASDQVTSARYRGEFFRTVPAGQ